MNLSLIFSALSFVFCLFFFFYFRWYLKRRTGAEQLLAEYRTEVLRLIADIDSATDRDCLLVEERIKTLKALLEDTDRRVSVYIRELDRSRSSEALYSSLGRLPRPAPPPAVLAPESPAEPENPPPSAPEKAQPVPQPVMSPAQAARPETAASSAGIPGEEGAEPAETAPGSLRSQIAALAAQGLSPEKIAARLDLSLSEVDLALNLIRHW